MRTFAPRPGTIDPAAWQHVAARALQRPGSPLSTQLRGFFEPRFGHDLGRIRVHTDHDAVAAARALGAAAFTAGRHVAFGANRYDPDTPAGRRLLAHELAHVIQQRGDNTPSHQLASSIGDQSDPAERAADAAAVAALQPSNRPVHVAPVPAPGVIRRTPDPPPAPKVPAAPTPAPAKTSTEAEAQTLAAYPKDADLEKAFARFKGIPEVSAITDPAKRRAFLARMSLYLGPAPAVENHYAKVKKAKFGKDQWAFETVVDRLNAVHDELKANGHAMPESGANFALRGLTEGSVQPRGLMVHALGLALDYRAVTNVRITDPRLVDLQSIFVNEAMRINVGKWQDRRAMVVKIGQGQATPKEIADFDAKFHSQFEAAALGSKAMQDILPKAGVARLSELSEQYRTLKKSEQKLSAREKKVPERERSGIKYWDEQGSFREGGSPRWEGLQAERRPLTEERAAIAKETTSLMDPVRLKVQGEMDRYLGQHPELKDLPDVEDLELEHKRSGAGFKAAAAALTKAKTVLEKAKKKVASANAALVRAADAAADAAERGKPSPRLDRLKDEASQRAEDAANAVLDAEKTFAEATSAMDAARADRDKWEGKYAFIGQERWFERLRTLRDALTDDLDFILVGERTVANPSVAQLLEKGYFNPDEPGKGGFDELFMTTMAHHGFDQGAEWEAGGVDSMHFELAEVVDKLSQPEDAKRKK